MEDRSRPDTLLRKYLHGQLSHEEYRELWVLLEQDPDEKSLNVALKELWETTGEKTSNISDKKIATFSRGYFIYLVGDRGFEPRTNGLRVRCSTN